MWQPRFLFWLAICRLEGAWSRQALTLLRTATATDTESHTNTVTCARVVCNSLLAHLGPLPSQLRIKFMQRVLIPRLPAERMKNALIVRGDDRVDKCRNKVLIRCSVTWTHLPGRSTLCSTFTGPLPSLGLSPGGLV